MKKRHINTDYLKLLVEPFFFCKLIVLKRRQPAEKTGAILIVNPCLVGEFAASVPALYDFIRRHPGKKIDLIVTPRLKPLAQKIRGVCRVFVTRSVYKREEEHGPREMQNFDAYEETWVLRMSKESYDLLKDLPTGTIRTSLRHFASFALHLVWNLVTGETPRRWGEVNFEMLGGMPKEFSFDELFLFEKEDSEAVERLECLRTAETKVLIHTGTPWPMKRWDTGRWIELVRMIHGLGNIRIIAVGGTEDRQEYERIASAVDFKLYSLIGEIDLKELLLVLRKSDYLIGVDSGPRNMAHLADTRSVTILGPGPHFYMPSNPDDIVIDKTRGRGLWQMFFEAKNPYIQQTKAPEVFAAFKRLMKARARKNRDILN